MDHLFCYQSVEQKPLEAPLQVFTVTWLLKHIPASLIGGFFFSFVINCEILLFWCDGSATLNSVRNVKSVLLINMNRSTQLQSCLKSVVNWYTLFFNLY